MLSLPELSVFAGSISFLVVANFAAPFHWQRGWFVALTMVVPATVAGALNLAYVDGVALPSRWQCAMLMAAISGLVQWICLAPLRQRFVYDHGREPILTTGVAKLEATKDDRLLSAIVLAICLGTTLAAMVLYGWIR